MGSFLSLMTSSCSSICASGARHCGGAGAFCQPVDAAGVVTKPLLFAGSELLAAGVVTKLLLFAGSELPQGSLVAGAELPQALVAGVELPQGSLVAGAELPQASLTAGVASQPVLLFTTILELIAGRVVY